MQITSHYPNVSLNTANPPTEQARRDMQRRELVEPVRDAEKAASERALSSDERSRNAASGVVTLYDSSGRETETSQAIRGREDDSPSDQQSSQQQASEQQTSEQQSAGTESASPQTSAEQQAEIDQQADAEQQQIRELQARDQEVRTHEQAHATVGGRYAGAPTYEYQQGPDGRRYAVGGEVQIDLAAIPGDPQATIQKMQQVKAAALAPAEPSSADRSIAAEATNRLLQAQAELIATKTAQLSRPTSAKDVASVVAEPQTEAIAPAISRPTIDSQLFDNSIAGIVLPQRERLEKSAIMQQRSQVIQDYYQLATEPRVSQYLQQA
ncbi:putative metalloprotease CJM1_0395 family protein [Alishewanella tabrizica]|uniref:SrpA-related protein n=1 Tax=Alishewanella tabrizica TaxID=671278 RepID=A0ABQ2WUE0_9ALTE|nr:putative metalloprotease CJM1_0395 family protein [Alishewanella tabrizica]GGW68739.1 hypothetical protein GCM10008111_25960 [Alishewanella tabrizica]